MADNELIPTYDRLPRLRDTPNAPPRSSSDGAGDVQWSYDPESGTWGWRPAEPIDTTAIDAAIDAIDGDIAAILDALSAKAGVNHTHDDRYFTETEADARFSPLAGSTSIVTVGTLASLTVSGSTITPTVSGSAASGGNLTLSSTSHVTKGNVYLNGTTTVVGSSGNLGIGTSPASTATLHTKTSTVNAMPVLFETASTTGSTGVKLWNSATSKAVEFTMDNGGALHLRAGSTTATGFGTAGLAMGTTGTVGFNGALAPSLFDAITIGSSSSPTPSSTLKMLRGSSEAYVGVSGAGYVFGSIPEGHFGLRYTGGLLIGPGNTPTFSMDAAGAVSVSTSVTSPTIHGSAASGGNLTLSSTSHATKGNVTINGGITVNSLGNLQVGAVASTIITSGTSVSAGDVVKVLANNDGAAMQIQNTAAAGFSGIEHLNNAGSLAVFTGYNNANGQFRFNNIATGGVIDFMIGSVARLSIANNGVVTATASLVSPTLSGSAASGGNLTLQSTSHATKGNVYLNGTNTFIASDGKIYVNGGSAGYIGQSGGATAFGYVGATALFRLLPAGNDIWFQNTVTAGNINFSGNTGASLTGNVQFKMASGGSVVIDNVREAADDTAAAALSPAIPVNGLYRTGSILKIRVS